MGTPHGGAHTADSENANPANFRRGSQKRGETPKLGERQATPLPPRPPPARTDGKMTGSNFISCFPSRAVPAGEARQEGPWLRGAGRGPGGAGWPARTPPPPPLPTPGSRPPPALTARCAPTCPPGGRRGPARPPGHFLPRPASREPRGRGAAGGKRLGRRPAEEAAAARTHRHHRGAGPRRPQPPDRTLGAAPRPPLWPSSQAARRRRALRPSAARRRLRQAAEPSRPCCGRRCAASLSRDRPPPPPPDRLASPARGFSTQPLQVPPPARRPAPGHPPPPIGSAGPGAGPGAGSHDPTAQPHSRLRPGASAPVRVRAPAGGGAGTLRAPSRCPAPRVGVWAHGRAAPRTQTFRDLGHRETEAQRRKGQAGALQRVTSGSGLEPPAPGGRPGAGRIPQRLCAPASDRCLTPCAPRLTGLQRRGCVRMRGVGEPRNIHVTRLRVAQGEPPSGPGSFRPLGP